MRRSFALALLLALPLSAGDGLRYRMQLWLRGSAEPLEAMLIVDTAPAIRSANRVQRPRLGGWRIRVEGKGLSAATEALVMARARRMLFLSTPVPQAEAQDLRVSFQGLALSAWKLNVPKNLDASAVLVEVAPRLLALCDLSAKPAGGDVARVELHLDRPGRLTCATPPEEGTALLQTLNLWAAETEGDGGIIHLH
ncbi:MAG TPA: hypothetical protein VJ600_04680 [Holophagaceae bacterium]|nr:hypothetical protein [Holophagaceae bacterium]